MRSDILAALNDERAARRAAILVTDIADGAQRLVRESDLAVDSRGVKGWHGGEGAGDGQGLGGEGNEEDVLVEETLNLRVSDTRAEVREGFPDVRRAARKLTLYRHGGTGPVDAARSRSPRAPLRPR